MTDTSLATLRTTGQTEPDEIERRAQELPWWNRPRRMRRQLSFSLAFVSFVSVLLVGGLNFFAASDLLQEGTEEQLVSIAEARTRSIEEGTNRLLSRVSALSSDLAVAAALEDFSKAFTDLEAAELTSDQQAELEDFYDERVIQPLLDVEADVTISDVFPPTGEGQFLQYHYGAVPDEERETTFDSENGSEYSEVHAQYHPFFTELDEILNAGDIKLITLDGDVVYSTEKQIDFGTNLVDGPYSDSLLADTLTVRLPRSRTGDAVISDFELYLPNAARPTAFAMAGVRSGTELLGALVVEIPNEALSAITTANGEWEQVGLKNGESYLVGADSVLRSESRLWIEDPEAYLDKVEDDLVARRIEFLGSPVGLQAVDTKAVRAALDGETFQGRSSNYLGEDMFSYARLIDVAGVNWVVVADVSHSSARRPLYSYLLRIGITLAILLPAAAAVGSFMARRVTRPVPVILRAAEEVADGEREPDLPDFGRNEFGDLATRLSRAAERLGRQEKGLEAQYEETRAVLLAALPPRVVQDGRRPTSSGELTDVATAVAIAVDLDGEDLRVDDALGDLYASASLSAEELAAERGIERVRAAADRYLFVAGLEEDDDGADSALDFAATFARRVTEFAAQEEISVDLQIGLSTGYVETGLMTRGNLTFTAWGEPVRSAMVIGSLSESTVVGVDATTVEVADSDRWTFSPAPPMRGLEDQPLDIYSLTLDNDSPDPTDNDDTT